MKHKRRGSSIGALNKQTVMSGAVLAGGAVAGMVISQKVTPMIVSAISATAPNPYYVNGGRIVLGIGIAAMAPSGMIGDVLKGIGAGIAADGGAKIAMSMINGTTQVAGPYYPTTAIGRHRRMAGPQRPTTSIGAKYGTHVGRVNPAPAPQGAAIVLNN